MRAERQHAQAKQKSEAGEEQEEGSRHIAVDATTAPRIQPTRYAHECEQRRPYDDEITFTDRRRREQDRNGYAPG